MADQEKKITFAADATKLRQESKKIYEDLFSEARKQTTSQKEQQRLVQDQLKVLKEQLKVEQDISRERERRARKSYEGATDPATEEFFFKKIQDEQRKQDELRGRKQALSQAGVESTRQFQDSKTSPNIGGQVFGGIIAAELVKGIMSSIGTLSTAKNEFDLVGKIPVVGTALQRSWELREQLYGARARNRAFTGSSVIAPNMTNFGLDRIESAGVQEGIIKAIGGQTTKEQIKNVAAISKAFNIDQGAINQFLGTGRMGSEVNEGQIVTLLREGIDRSKLVDATQNMTQLLQVIGQSTLSPSMIDARQKVVEFNSVGGPFSVGDPRSAGLIGGISQQLANPGDAFGQALSYSVLRKQNPNMSMLDLIIQRQKGEQSYIGDVMRDIAGMGGSEDFQVMQFAKVVGLTGNIASARHLFRNRGKIGVGGEFASGIGTDLQAQLYKEASDATTSIEKSTAAVTNAFIDDFAKGWEKLIEKFGDKVEDELSTAVEEVADFLEEKLQDAVVGGLEKADDKMQGFFNFISPGSSSRYLQLAKPPGSAKNGN